MNYMQLFVDFFDCMHADYELRLLSFCKFYNIKLNKGENKLPAFDEEDDWESESGIIFSGFANRYKIFIPFTLLQPFIDLQLKPKCSQLWLRVLCSRYQTYDTTSLLLIQLFSQFQVVILHIHCIVGEYKSLKLGVTSVCERIYSNIVESIASNSSLRRCNINKSVTWLVYDELAKVFSRKRNEKIILDLTLDVSNVNSFSKSLPLIERCICADELLIWVDFESMPDRLAEFQHAICKNDNFKEINLTLKNFINRMDHDDQTNFFEHIIRNVKSPIRIKTASVFPVFLKNDLLARLVKAFRENCQVVGLPLTDQIIKAYIERNRRLCVRHVVVDVCISLQSLFLPRYVLLWIIDFLPYIDEKRLLENESCYYLIKEYDKMRIINAVHASFEKIYERRNFSDDDCTSSSSFHIKTQKEF